MPVGNDVVDLRDPANQPEALHPRFDRRVFGEADLALLDACPDRASRHRLRWSLWAARESAFKYVRQVVPHAVFRPRAMAVRPDGDGSDGSLVWGDRVLALSLDADSRRVHAVVRAAGSGPATEDVSELAGDLTPAACSAQVRAMAERAVARVLDLEPGTVRVAVPAGALTPFPRALRGDDVLPIDVSLSHDGAWIACAVAPICP